MCAHLQGDTDALLLSGAGEDEAQGQRRIARHLDIAVVVRHQRRQQLQHLQSQSVRHFKTTPVRSSRFVSGDALCPFAKALDMNQAITSYGQSQEARR